MLIMHKRSNSSDFLLMFIVFALLLIGLIMVFSASSYTDLIKHNGDAYYTFKRQLTWAGIGFFAMIFTMNYDYHKLKKFSIPLLIVSIMLLVVVLFMPGIKDVKRWIGIGPLTFQPSEIAKFSIALYMASTMSQNMNKIKSFTHIMLNYVLVGGLVFGLILIEPNLSMAGTVLILVFIMLIAAGAKVSHLSFLAVVGSCAAVVFTMSEDYRYRRFTAFLDPWKDPLDTGYQAVQSLLALGSGGLTGMGLGKSRQKFFYIPEPQNDFIFSIIGEELGFRGSVIIITLFLLLVWRGIKIAMNAVDNFGSLLAVGLTSLIAIQTIINIAVATSSMPITGIPLPFISYGGTSLVFMMITVGVLLNISRYQKKSK